MSLSKKGKNHNTGDSSKNGKQNEYQPAAVAIIGLKLYLHVICFLFSDRCIFLIFFYDA